MFGRYLQKTKRFWDAISPHSCLNLFRNMCERSWRQIQPIARKMDLTGMYRGALDSGLKTFRSTFNLLTNQRIIFLKNLSSGLKIIRQFVKVDQNIQKPLTKAARYILIKSFLLAIGWSYLHGLSHTFLKRLKLL